MPQPCQLFEEVDEQPQALPVEKVPTGYLLSATILCFREKVDKIPGPENPGALEPFARAHYPNCEWCQEYIFQEMKIDANNVSKSCWSCGKRY